MELKQVILYVRGISTSDDFARAERVIRQVAGVEGVEQHHIPGQDGSVSLNQQVLVTYRAGETVPGLFETELEDAGFHVVLQESLGTTLASVSPLKDLKTDVSSAL